MIQTKWPPTNPARFNLPQHRRTYRLRPDHVRFPQRTNGTRRSRMTPLTAARPPVLQSAIGALRALLPSARHTTRIPFGSEHGPLPVLPDLLRALRTWTAQPPDRMFYDHSSDIPAVLRWILEHTPAADGQATRAIYVHRFTEPDDPVAQRVPPAQRNEPRNVVAHTDGRRPAMEPRTRRHRVPAANPHPSHRPHQRSAAAHALHHRRTRPHLGLLAQTHGHAQLRRGGRLPHHGRQPLAATSARGLTSSTTLPAASPPADFLRRTAAPTVTSQTKQHDYQPGAARHASPAALPDPCDLRARMMNTST